MSAFVVDPETIAAIIGEITWDAPDAGSARHFGLREYMASEGWPTATEEERERLAVAMWDMNVDAVCQRYPGRETPEAHPWPGTGRIYHRGNVQGYKSLQCYLYQCTEGDVPERPLYKTLDRCSDLLAHGIVRQLDMYERAEWG
jgi:hypothetical protein